MIAFKCLLLIFPSTDISINNVVIGLSILSLQIPVYQSIEIQLVRQHKERSVPGIGAALEPAAKLYEYPIPVIIQGACGGWIRWESSSSPVFPGIA